MTSTLGNFDVPCSLQATNKLRHHPILMECDVIGINFKLWHHPILMTCMTSSAVMETMTSSYLNEMQDVICVNLFPRKLMKFPRKKPE